MGGDDPREGGLADAGRSPEDHRGDLVVFDETAQYFARAEEVFLAGIFIQRLRAHARGEGLRGILFK